MAAHCLGCGRPIPVEHQAEDWHPGCWRKHTKAPRFTDSTWVAPSKGRST